MTASSRRSPIGNGNTSGDAQRGSVVREIGVGLDPGRGRGECVALRFGDIELRRDARAIAIRSELRGALGRALLIARRAALGDAGFDPLERLEHGVLARAARAF